MSDRLLGRRITRTLNTGTPTRYVYDGWNVIAEYTGSTLERTYTWGMDLSRSMQGAGGVGGLLAVKKGPATYYPTYDGNGNISEYLNSAGAIVAHYEYDPFGNTTAITGSQATTFAHRFSTKPLDATTGLYYYGYRYYDASSGRFINRDPIKERGGANLYGFVRNSPITFIDLLGLEGKNAAKPPTAPIFIYPYTASVVPGTTLVGEPTKKQFEELYDIIKKLNEKEEDGKDCWQVYLHLKGPATVGQVLYGSVKCDRTFVIAHGKKQDGNDFVELANGHLSVELANRISKPYGGSCTGIGCRIGDNKNTVAQSGTVQQLIDQLRNLLEKGGCPCERICIYSGPVNSAAGKKQDFVTEDDLPEVVQDALNKFREKNPIPAPEPK